MASNLSLESGIPPVDRGKKRSSLVSILGLLLIIDCTLSLVRRAPDILANPLSGPLANPKFAYDTVSILLLFISAFGILMRKQWARMLTLCLMILSLAEGIFLFVLYSFLLDSFGSGGTSDSQILVYRSYPVLVGSLLYTFFIAVLFTKKVRSEFESATPPQERNLQSGNSFAERRASMVVMKRVAVGAGITLALGFSLFLLLSGTGAPRKEASHPPRTVWMSMGNLGRTGSVIGRGVHKPDELLWNKRLSPMTGTFLLAVGDRLYVTNGSRLTAMDAASGSELWVFMANPVSSSPLVVDDTVFVGTEIGALYGIDAATGRETWRFQTGKSRFSVTASFIASAPVSDGERVYFGNTLGYLYAVDLESKQEVWKFKARYPVVSSPALDADTLYFGCGDGKLYALSLLEGRTRWVYNSKKPIQSTPVVWGDQVLIGNEDGITSLDSVSGERQWSFPARTAMRSSPAVVNETVFVGDKDRHFSALDLGSGSLKWQWTADAAIVGTPVAADGIVYFGSADGTVYAVTVDTGREQWRYRPPDQAGFDSSFAVRDYALYFSDVRGMVYALSEKREAPGE